MFNDKHFRLEFKQFCFKLYLSPWFHLHIHLMFAVKFSVGFLFFFCWHRSSIMSLIKMARWVRFIYHFTYSHVNSKWFHCSGMNIFTETMYTTWHSIRYIPYILWIIFTLFQRIVFLVFSFPKTIIEKQRKN